MGEPVTSLLPPKLTIPDLAEAAGRCQACELWARASQTVFGAGAVDARLFVIGEQPGDREDVAGLPFVGPAGQLLDKALDEAGVDRSLVYVTNVVKHFKWSERRGKRRLHKSPNRAEVQACLPWLEAELASIRPALLVLLGATAAHALLGSGFKVSVDGGRVIDSPFGPVLATVHPSSILRSEARSELLAGLVEDLRTAAAYVAA